MIQLGSILAVMWLYRQRIIDVVTGLPTKPEARRFALMLFLAFLPGRVHRLLRRRFREDGAAESLQIIAWALLIGGVLMLALEKIAPKPVVTDAAQTPIWRAVAVGFAQCIAHDPRRFTFGRDHLWRPAAGARPARGGGVFVLPGDADDDGGVRL